MRISDWSSDVCSSDLSLPQRKPDPAPLRRAAELLGVAMAAVTYVGDSEVDAATAAAVGVPFLLFTEGYRKTPVEALPHRARFDRFLDLPGLLETLAAAPEIGRASCRERVWQYV